MGSPLRVAFFVPPRDLREVSSIQVDIYILNLPFTTSGILRFLA